MMYHTLLHKGEDTQSHTFTVHCLQVTFGLLKSLHTLVSLFIWRVAPGPSRPALCCAA